MNESDERDKTDRVYARQGLQELEVFLRERLRGQARDLRVEMTDKGIILRGKARTYYAKQLAQEVLLERTPLPLVANEIEVSL
jgi:hypothetical protein